MDSYPLSSSETKTDTWIETSSGSSIDLINPKSYQIKIWDIAHALSHICRFGGHCRWHYSVAQHSVLVSYLVPVEFALEALLHDAAEAYLGDVVRPLKVNGDMEGYRAAEKLMEAAIIETFGIGDISHPLIKLADMQMLAAEREVLLTDKKSLWQCLEGVSPAPLKIEKLTPEQAREMFMARLQEILMHGPQERVGRFL
ncbi:MAG: HD family hydrolase [Pseudohongiella sp.]|nr:HD family hydrolase [Pseudohongiella sp.]